MARLIRYLAVFLWVCAAPALAEWRSEVRTVSGVQYATVAEPTATLSIICAAPGTGRVEAAGPPFAVSLKVSGRLVAPGDALRATLFAGETGFQLPPAGYDAGLEAWFVSVPMGDPLFAALRGADRLTLDGGRGQAWEYAATGLGAALDRAFTACISAWAASGVAVPQGLEIFAPSRASAGLPGTVAARMRQGCQGGYTFDPNDLLRGEIDGDGVPDYVLDWNDVRCTGAYPRPFCGAANCSIEPFLSSRGLVVSERDILLGVAPRLIALSNGRMGIMISGSIGLCSEGACDRPWWWDGRQLRQ